MKYVSPALLIVFLFFSSTLCTAAPPSPRESKGSLVIAGGNLKDGTGSVFDAFIKCAMKRRGTTRESLVIGVLPAASITPIESANSIRYALMAAGIKEPSIKLIPVAVCDDPSTRNMDESTWKKNAFDRDIALNVQEYDGIWFVGGDQARYIQALYDDKGGDSPVLAALWKAYRAGAVLGGSSAGAAIMSNPMIGGGTSLDALLRGVKEGLATDDDKDRKLIISRGLGFFGFGMVDQHFSQRGRLGRLIRAAMYSGSGLAFGIDEDTAMIVDNEHRLITVAGVNGVTIVNLRGARNEGTPERPAVQGICVSYLEKGSSCGADSGDPIPVRTASKTPGMETYICPGSIFEEAKWAMVRELAPAGRRVALGISTEMTGEGEAEGYMLRFSKTAGTVITWSTEKDRPTAEAVNVNLDLVPVKLRIEKL